MRAERLIPLGIITAPHGIKGEVRIRSYTSDPVDITAYGPLCDANGERLAISIKSHSKEVLIASIEGVASRDAAEALRNTTLCVPRSALPEADAGEYYHEDLIGLAVSTEDGAAYGTIAAVYNFGAGDLVAIKRISGEEELIPFARAAFPRIDLENGTATVVPPTVVAGE